MTRSNSSYSFSQFKESSTNFIGSSSQLDENSKTKIQDTLSQLIHSFGFSASSFWFMDDDHNLFNPLSVNINPSLINDYHDSLHIYDDFYPTKWITKETADSPVIINNVTHASPTPYTARLKEAQLYHSCSFMLKKDNKSYGTIALFSEYEKPMSLTPKVIYGLSQILPFLRNAIETELVSNKLRQNASIMESALNNMNTGVIIFERNTNNVMYSNPISLKYCYEFMPFSRPHSVISDFIRQIICPFDRPFSNIKNLSIDLSAPTGNMYHINIEDHYSGSDNIVMLFITPQNSHETSIKNGKLFAALTPKEREITLLITQGLTNSQIAEHLFISLSTVKSHIQHIFDKANVTNRTSLLAVLHEQDNSSEFISY